jgi:predicted dithiol-disulfide oxidoreductase (DUF899 family)
LPRGLLASWRQPVVDGLVRALERGVHGGSCHLECLGDLSGREAEDIAEDEDRSLFRRDVLQRGNERELDGLTLLVAGVWGGESVLEFDAGVWIGLEPDGLDERCRQRIVRVGGGPVVDREHSLGPPLDRFQAGVGRDPVEPGLERAAALELGQGPPRVQQRLLAQRRQELPWVPIDKEYRFETDAGIRALADLFDGRSQLLVYHFMFGPEYSAGCPSCSAIADGFDGSVVHLVNHDVAFYAVSRAPLAKLQAYKQRMGWTFPWASSFGSDFNFDFHVSHTKEEWQAGAVEYNYRTVDFRGAEASPLAVEFASSTGTDFATYRREGPGVSAFGLEDDVVYHTYSAYERGIDGLWSMYQWLDRAPFGRNESGFWWHRHDEYDHQPNQPAQEHNPHE